MGGRIVKIHRRSPPVIIYKIKRLLYMHKGSTRGGGQPRFHSHFSLLKTLPLPDAPSRIPNHSGFQPMTQTLCGEDSATLSVHSGMKLFLYYHQSAANVKCFLINYMSRRRILPFFPGRIHRNMRIIQYESIIK